MNSKVAVRNCREYNPDEVYTHISDIYDRCNGPDVNNKKVLLKPNILNDVDPLRCVTTHPVVVEAMIRFLQERNATVLVGIPRESISAGSKARNPGFIRFARKQEQNGSIS